MGVGVISYVSKSFVQTFLGLSVIIFVVLSFFKIELNDADPGGSKGGIIGLIAGVIGGITSAFGPLLVIFLKTQKLEKAAFVSTLCFLILAGAVTLSISLGAFSIYTQTTFLLAILACIPTFAGLWIGERIRSYFDTETFFKFVSIAILLIGLNLVRAGVTGLLG